MPGQGDISIPWASEVAQQRLREIQSGSEPGTPADLERARAAVREHVDAMDDSGLVLYAGSNGLTGSIASAHDGALGVRPSLGYPGEKVQPGLEHLEILEVLTTRAVGVSMGAEHADVRVQSATLANLAVYAGLTSVGATLAVLPTWAGGHFSHHAEGAAGIRGHRVVELPYDIDADDVDVEALPAFLERENPALVVLGGTLMLFPHRLDRIVEAVHATGARLLYDASHVAGLIAGGRFQAPLLQGADVVTFSTYKSYGGPPGGAIVTNDADVAERVSAAVYPGLTANFDAGRLRALGVAAGELLDSGPEYAGRCIDAARALARALDESGFLVAGKARGFTESHQLAVLLPEAASGRPAMSRLADAGVFASAAQVAGPAGPVAALRLGTQELVRRGFAPADMRAVGELIARVLIGNEPPSEVRPDVYALRLRPSRR